MTTRHKFNARKTEYRGEVYDSAAEAKDAVDLDAMVAAGEIADWARGLNWLVGGDGKKTTTSVYYRPDFEVTLLDWSVVLVDRKGWETRVFQIKEKLFRGLFPDRPLLVVKSGTSIRQALAQHQAPPAPKSRRRAAA